MNFRSILEPNIPPEGGNTWRFCRREVMFTGAMALFFGSGQRWGLKRSNGGQVTTGFLHSACCLRRYSITIESREMTLFEEKSVRLFAIGEVKWIDCRRLLMLATLLLLLTRLDRCVRLIRIGLLRLEDESLWLVLDGTFNDGVANKLEFWDKTGICRDYNKNNNDIKTFIIKHKQFLTTRGSALGGVLNLLKLLFLAKLLANSVSLASSTKACAVFERPFSTRCL